MRKYIICLFLFPNILLAQPYVEFISTTDSSDTWMDVLSCTDMSCYQTRTKRYTIEGDTVIGQYQYAKLYVREEYEQGADQSQWCTESTSIYNYYFGAIRESGKQVFVMPSLGAEYIAYDFNLNVGDTIPSPINIAGNDDWRIIDSIDLVMIDGVDRKRYWVSFDRYVIEGIGASSGLFNPLYPSFGICSAALLCYSEYDTPQHFDDDCDMNLGVDDDLSIDASPAELIKIVDITGREIAETPNTLMIYLYSDGSSKKVFKVK
ncbi:MAG: hypothetical protein P8P74_16760 [Crocinitomicaceae bacterium]|nr:hypothetical protein [Crocinitomicaceae bacterium]